MTDGLSVDGAPEVHVFYAGRREDPDGIVLVARIDLLEGHEIDTVRALKDYVLRACDLDEEQFDALVEAGGVRLGTRGVSGYQALEMQREKARDGGLTRASVTTRALTVPAGGFLVSVVHINLDGMDVSAGTTWEYLLDSLHVDAPDARLRSVLLHGGAALGGLILLVLVVRLLLRVRRDPSVLGAALAAPSASAQEGWGRAAGGVPGVTGSARRTPPRSPGAGGPLLGTLPSPHAPGGRAPPASAGAAARPAPGGRLVPTRGAAPAAGEGAPRPGPTGAPAAGARARLTPIPGVPVDDAPPGRLVPTRAASGRWEG